MKKYRVITVPLLSLLLVFLVLLVVPVSCGRGYQSAPGPGGMGGGGQMEGAYMSREESDKSASVQLAKYNPSQQPSGEDEENAPERKIIRNANLSLYVEDLKSAVNDIEGKIIQYGGYISGSQYQEYSQQISSTITLKIPAEKLHEFIKEIESLGKVTASQVQSEDVTDQYYDMDARLRAKKKQEERLLALLDKENAKLEEILQLEQELARVRGEIESMEGRIRLWDQQVAYSTITLSIYQNVEIAREPEDMWKPLRAVLRNAKNILMSSLSVMINILAGIIALVIALLPWAIIVYLIILIQKRFFPKLLQKKGKTGEIKQETPKQEKEEPEKEKYSDSNK